MRTNLASGSSLIETLIGLALIATTSAVMLPALVAASRLQRASAMETEAVSIAAGWLDRIAGDAAAGRLNPGGRVDVPADGWHVRLDRTGVPASGARAAYETRWHIALVGGPPRVAVVTVRVVSLAERARPVTISTAVPDG